MGLLKQLRNKTRTKNDAPTSQPVYEHSGLDLTRRLPSNVLELVFSYVCPHTQDHTYLACDDVPIGSDCMLCDLRDLSHCLQTCSRWRDVAEKMLYTSVRIDAVHYCILEEELALRRNKGTKFKKSKYIDPVAVPGIRLALLCRTVRENSNLATHVQYLKLPYTTWESGKADLARAVAVLPKLRYVDLPDGFYAGAEPYSMLRTELQAHCPRLGKTQYRRGAEIHLNHLLQRRWQFLESLDLKDIAIDTGQLQLVLASLPVLSDLTLSDLPWLDDSVFASNTQYAMFPAIQTLKLKHIPNVTARGLLQYLSHRQNQQTLLSLTLLDTGVLLGEIHDALWKAVNLEYLSVFELVSRPLLVHKETPYLTSPSLRTLVFEVENTRDVQGLQHPDDSYYAYLASSLYASALPALTTLYVRERHFPERLMPSLQLSSRDATHLSVQPQVPRGGLHQTLQVFSKDGDEVQWMSTSITASNTKRLSAASSNHSLVPGHSMLPEMIPPWARGGLEGEARRSIVVSTGHGAFLPMTPNEDAAITSGDEYAQPGARDHDDYLRPPLSLALLKAKRASRNDLWR